MAWRRERAVLYLWIATTWAAGRRKTTATRATVPLSTASSANDLLNHFVYVLSDSDALRQFEVKDGKLSLKAEQQQVPTICHAVFIGQWTEMAWSGYCVEILGMDPSSLRALCLRRST